MQKNFLSIKIIAIVGLITLFFFSLLFISGLVSERQAYQHSFIQDISQSQISAQSVISPFIRVSYTENTTCIDDQKKTYPCTQTFWRFIGAENTDWNADFKVSNDTYKRGIYRAMSYQANLTAKGIFQKPELQDNAYEWNKAEIVFPIHDPRGLNQQPNIQIAGKTYQFEISPESNNASGFDFMVLSTQKRPELLAAIQNGFNFNLKLDTYGLSKFILIPSSHHITYQAKGNWADTKYDGQLLPFEKQSTHYEFAAQWKNIALGKQNLNQLAQCQNNECIRQFYTATSINEYGESTQQKMGISTEFLEPVNVYSQTDHAIKYGIVIIIISFGCFFLFEILKSLRIHPIQYSLVATAQGIFFVLLLSISEYYAFTWAYIVASFACVSLMTWYLYFVMRGFKAAIMFGIILGSLYAIMFMLLQSSGKTFLIGSVISFIILATVMFITRHIDWYQIGMPKSEPEQPSEDLNA